jgi:hypothetical protein
MSTITKRSTGFVQSNEPLNQLTQDEAELAITALRIAVNTKGLSKLSEDNIRRIIFKLEMSIE